MSEGASSSHVLLIEHCEISVCSDLYVKRFAYSVSALSEYSKLTLYSPLRVDWYLSRLIVQAQANMRLKLSLEKL